MGAVYRPDDGALTPVYVVDLNGIVFGDVTGDGHKDAIFVTECVYASAEVLVEVWSYDDDGQPRHLPPVKHFSKFESVVDRVEAVGGELRIHSREGAVGDGFPHLNGYPIAVVTGWSFDGAKWLAHEVDRVDIVPEPNPQPEPDSASIAECATPSASADHTVRCLVAAVNTQDNTKANRVATSDVVATLHSWRDDWGPLQWGFTGCDQTCWWYEASADPQHHGLGIEMGVESHGGTLTVVWVETYG